MRQTTLPEQTAKLITLGLEKPKQFIEGPTLLDSRFAYSIGELIEMLDGVSGFEIIQEGSGWAYMMIFEHLQAKS
jgi:hypothetical protein